MRILLLLLLLLLLVNMLSAMTYSNTPLMSELVYGVEICNDTMYEITDWGLLVYDVTNKTNPVLITKLPLCVDGYFGNFIRRIDDFLVVSGNVGSVLFDISVPTEPLEIYRLPIPNINDCVIQGNYFIVNNLDYSQSNARSYLNVYNMGMFPLLQALDTLENTASFELIANNLYVIDRVYLTGAEPNPQAPIRLCKYSIEVNTGHLVNAGAVTLPWHYIAYASFYPGLQTYNNQIWAYVKGYLHQIDYTGGTMQLVSSTECNPDNVSSSGIMQFAIANGAFFNDNREVFLIGSNSSSDGKRYQLPIRTNPIMSNSSATGTVTPRSKPKKSRMDATWINGMKVEGNYLYTAEVELGYVIYDISVPSQPAMVCMHSNFQCIMDVKVSGNLLFAVSWTEYEAEGSPSGLYIYDISNPETPQLLTYYCGSDDYFYSVHLRGDYAFVGGEFGMRIFNVSDPQNIEWVAVANSVVTYEAAFFNDYIYTLSLIAPASAKFKVTDISQINAPVVYSILDTYGSQMHYAMDIEINQDYLYVLDSNIYQGQQHYIGGLKIYSLANPLQPALVATLNPNPNRSLRSMVIKDNYLYISGNFSFHLNAYEVWVIDISSPENPVVVSSYTSNLRCYDNDMQVLGDRIYTADRNIIDISDPLHLTLLEHTTYNPDKAVTLAVAPPYFYEARMNSLNIYSIASTPNEDDALPVAKALNCYPNPFSLAGNSGNGSTNISFDVSKTGTALVTVYNVKGQKVKTLFEAKANTGKHNVTWNGTDDSGRKIAPGVYLYKYTLNGKLSSVAKCLVLK